MSMRIFENIINHKINTITAEELLKYAKQFNISVNRLQAKKIAEYLRGKNVNIFDDAQRATLVKEIAKAAGPETAREVNKLFMQFTKT
jgi:ribosomal protein L12E/L44/L45/RPP1/RPP2